MANAATHRPILSTVLNDWTNHPVDSISGVITLRTVTPDGQHIIVTLTDAQARYVSGVLADAAQNAALNRVVGEARYNLACGCDVRDVDASDHLLSCSIAERIVDVTPDEAWERAAEMVGTDVETLGAILSDHMDLWDEERQCLTADGVAVVRAQLASNDSCYAGDAS